jgi:hypothetical protein
LSVWRGRLSARGYRVEVSEAGLFCRLEIEKPGRLFYRGREPGRGLTRKGALLVLAGVPVALALLLALLLPLTGVPALLPVAGALALALAAGLTVTFWRWPLGSVLDRAVTFAWNSLVAPLRSEGLAEEDSAFAAGLALVSAGHGDAADREEILELLRRDTEAAVAAGPGPVKHLAAFWRLTAEDLAGSGGDAVAMVAAQIGRCFEGKLPLSFAGQLLHHWEAPWWTAGSLARLRVLLCDRAFEAGLEVQDLIEIGRITPPLGAALKTEDVIGLAHLRLLWSLRPLRPWDRFGKNATVFEIAADPEVGRGRLAKHPDLLISFEGAPVISLGDRGLVCLDQLFTRPPRTVEVVSRQLLHEEVYELILDEQRFQFASPPDETALRLERLFRYFFNDFRAQVAEVPRWRSPVVSRPLRSQNAVPCPQCGQPVVTRVGEVGISMEVAADIEPPARSPKPAAV